MPQIVEAIKDAKGQVVYVCNVMTQEGETTGYTAADHVQAICDHIGDASIDAIVVHNEPIEKAILMKVLEK